MVQSIIVATYLRTRIDEVSVYHLLRRISICFKKIMYIYIYIYSVTYTSTGAARGFVHQGYASIHERQLVRHCLRIISVQKSSKLLPQQRNLWDDQKLANISWRMEISFRKKWSCFLLLMFGYFSCFCYWSWMCIAVLAIELVWAQLEVSWRGV